jgi:alpha-tubulin suppressor-like RCC1 family protein
VLRSEGAAYCWGYNSNGQLGDGSTVSRTAPVAVGGGIGFASVTPGAFHSCGLTPSGEAYCWGANSYGRLGDGSETQRTAPAAVSGGHVFSSLSAGLDHTCAVETATHQAFCWGRGQSGQRGDGTMTTSTVPLVTFGSSLLGFDRVSAGGQHSCAIARDGTVFCWGLNAQGQLGDGTTWMRFIPTAVSGDLTFQSLAVNNNNATWESTCGVTPEGRAYCWGLNNGGQLGRGTTGGQFSVPQSVFGGLVFTSVSPGLNHTCGVTTGGEAYCWGWNDYGQLGNGTAGVDEGTNTPTLVTGGHPFRYVGAGSNYSCGLTTDDEVYCWGLNSAGQLGNGTNTSSSEPVLVGGLPPALR